MLRNYRLEILAGVVILAFIGLFYIDSILMPAAEFAGSDSVASGQISEISGIPEDDFQPLIPQWTPPAARSNRACSRFRPRSAGLSSGTCSARGVPRNGTGPSLRLKTTPTRMFGEFLEDIAQKNRLRE